MRRKQAFVASWILLIGLVLFYPALGRCDESGSAGKAPSPSEHLLDTQTEEVTPLTRKHLKTHVVFLPVARDELNPALLKGRGDIAAADITITPERRQLIDFFDPYLPRHQRNRRYRTVLARARFGGRPPGQGGCRAALVELASVWRNVSTSE